MPWLMFQHRGSEASMRFHNMAWSSRVYQQLLPNLRYDPLRSKTHDSSGHSLDRPIPSVAYPTANLRAEENAKHMTVETKKPPPLNSTNSCRSPEMQGRKGAKDRMRGCKTCAWPNPTLQNLISQIVEVNESNHLPSFASL